MSIIPYLTKEYTSTFSKDEIINKLKSRVKSKDWEISFEKLINNRSFEGEFQNNSFRIVMGKYGLTYGRSSLLPIMTGIITENEMNKTTIKILIETGGAGKGILFFIFSIAFLGIYTGIVHGKSPAIIGCSLFSIIIYVNLILKYNREAPNYLNLVEQVI